MEPAQTHSSREQHKINTGLDRSLMHYLTSLEDPRREKILDFHKRYENLISQAKGSQTKHQAWPGGYKDHVTECFRIADSIYEALNTLHRTPFAFASAIIVLYFHDCEKIWKYTTGLPDGFNKDHFYDVTLQDDFGITFSEEERNALHYIHGESDKEYDPLQRKAGPLAAFCHAADHLSARMWPFEGRGLG